LCQTDEAQKKLQEMAVLKGVCRHAFVVALDQIKQSDFSEG
jgi:hypothetical protein